MSVRLRATNIDATRVLASVFPKYLRSGDVLLLDGELGAGKTAFTQFLAQAMGVTEPVTSPTFAIMNHYECGPDSPVNVLAHLDAYRLGDAEAIDQLGLFELLDDGAVAVIEWGSIVASSFRHVLNVEFVVTSEHSREITLSTSSPQWSVRLKQIVSKAGLPSC